MAPPPKRRPNRSKRGHPPRDGDAAGEQADLQAMLERLGALGGPDTWGLGEPSAEVLDGPSLNVILSTHAQRQLQQLGVPAQRALVALREMSYEEIRWSSEHLPPQRGREVRMLWAGSVRILFDIEDSDLTVQGFGLRPGW